MTNTQDKVREIKGTITLDDGTTSEFRIGKDFGWQQWGADPTRLSRSVKAVDAMAYGLREESVDVVSEHDADDEDDDPERDDVFDGTCSWCNVIIRTDSRQDETGSTRCDDTSEAHRNHIPAGLPQQED